jgi:hypothetical protein
LLLDKPIIYGRIKETKGHNMLVGKIVSKRDGRVSSREEFLFHLEEGDKITLTKGHIAITTKNGDKNVFHCKAVKIVLL